jgi:ABC-type sugar transport system ATPase subunit
MIAVRELHIVQGQFSLTDVSLTIPRGEYGILMGRTGCGKTTVLESVCGLRSIRGGTIELDGRDVTNLKPAERGIGYVPQDDALFTTMSVRDNLAFALDIRKWPRGDIEERVGELAAMLGIGHLLDRFPKGLSGGEARRVALGRALACHPPTLCLDEPLSALDHDTSIEVCDLLADVKTKLGVTVLHITHDRNEAARLADHLLLLQDGKIQRA